MNEVKNKMTHLDISLAAVIISSVALRRLKYLLYVIQILFVIFGIKHLGSKINKKYILFRVLLIVYILLSFIWSTSQSSVMTVLPSIAQIILLTSIMCGYVDDTEKIDKFINMFVWASVALIISIIIFTPLSEWQSIIRYSSDTYMNVSSSAGRLGNSIGMHPNGLGQTLVVCILCVTYKLISTRQKKYMLLNIILFILLFFVKSRSSLIEAILAAIIVFIFSKKRMSKQILYGLFGILMVIVLIIAFIKIPMLYNMVGYRIEGMLDLFSKTSSADASTLTRLKFVNIGWELFLRNPLLGVGMNNFSYIAYNEYSIFAQVYSHNNFIEILSNLGLIGFFLYYYLYVYAFKKLYKIVKNYNYYKLDDIFYKAGLLFSSLLVLAIMDISHITYETEFVQYMGMLIIIGSSILYKKYKEIIEVKD